MLYERKQRPWSIKELFKLNLSQVNLSMHSSGVKFAGNNGTDQPLCCVTSKECTSGAPHSPIHAASCMA